MSVVKKQTLNTDPIIEALFELRFSCKEGLPDNLLAGVLYNALKEHFPKSEMLDINNLPVDIREKDANLKYAAYQRFTGEGAQVNVGPRVFSVACQRAYMGWDRFKPLILECLGHLHETGFVETVERHSLRYINLIQVNSPSTNQFSKINFNGKLGNIDLNETKTQMQIEFVENEILKKISVSSDTNVEFTQTEEKSSGIMLDIDCIMGTGENNFWENRSGYIDAVHEAVTDIFFETASMEALYECGYK
jgi:uncharacterized protein (TIGR04255 family)